MKVLIGFEFSGRVRDWFIKQGHEAVSVDLVASERPGPHIISDVRNIISDQWDIGIFFPPCTELCVSGNRWYAGTQEREESLELIRELMNTSIPKVAIENPIGVISTEIQKPTQIVHPYWFGHPYPKATCLWLKGLPKLKPTNIVKVTDRGRIHSASTKNRQQVRSRTPWGLAGAMAKQWGGNETL